MGFVLLFFITIIIMIIGLINPNLVFGKWKEEMATRFYVLFIGVKVLIVCFALLMITIVAKDSSFKESKQKVIY